MTMPFTRAPHRGDPVGSAAPNAALLIDFDNVTMGMRSDLSRDLRKLLESDIIKGKVTVQRAYADWRRYPQYIVPLSENSIDLIFAPAYGSSKKNATDIRMAIDAMELVFVRPEIGTFILLTGDSDFSSCVLKLKEYGKYVIGVGIQESSSDILVQNCDEYYSYTSITGLQKTTGGDQKSMDPWVLVEKAIKTMADRGDVMRSDRLKQVMMEVDPSFDEGSYGFSKFSRFIAEAASKNLLQLRKMENGQYEVAPAGPRSSTGGGGGGRRADESRSRGRGRGRREERREEPARTETAPPAEAAPPVEAAPAPDGGEPGGDPLQSAYDLLVRALGALRDDGRHPARDSDVKRRMLEFERDFDEAELGFGKFSRFLRQAHDHEVVDLHKEEGGNYEVALRGSTPPRERTAPPEEPAPSDVAPDAGPMEAPVPEAEARTGARGAVVRELRPEDVLEPDAPGRRLGPRGGTTRRRGAEEPPPFFAGQAAPSSQPAEAGEAVAADGLDPAELGLPTDAEAQIRYLSNSYKGVGKKTAEILVEEFGEHLFEILESDPERIHQVVPQNRAERVIEAWHEDLRRRQGGGGNGGDEEGGNRGGGRRGRRPRRSRGGSR
jgi:uncharacterized protein (TIGR00288 family)